MRRHYLPALFWLLSSSTLTSQNLLNGGFELNNAACGINLQNNTFNQTVPFVQAFGAQSEVDVLNGNCGFGAAAQGSDFIALYSNNGSDAVAMQLSAPLEAGKTYTLRFYDKNGLGMNQPQCRVQVGLSGTADAFGDLLYDAPPARNDWTLREVVFQPDQPFTHLTGLIASPVETWIFLDGFELVCSEIYLGPDTTLCRVDGVVLEVDPSRFDQITWSDGSTGPTLSVQAPGLYWAEGQSGGCTVRDSVVFIEFERNCDCKVFLPNVFSPNDDGINDVFSPQSPCKIEDYELLIANRWGQLVFRTQDPNEGWNGISRQQMAQPGVYIYWMRYRFSYAAEPELVKGEFLLVR